MPNKVPNRSPAFHREEAIAEVERRAVALWPRIANEVGLPVENVAFSILPVNHTRRDTRAVLGIKTPDGRRFVLRADFQTNNIKRLMEHHEQHRKASLALRDVPGVSVPELRWMDATRPYALFDFAPGETAQRELFFATAGLTNRATLLEQLGRAVAALHTCGKCEEQRFWPKVYLRDVGTIASRVRAGELQIRKPKRFLGLCAMLHQFARKAKGSTCQIGLAHGDLHLKNILVTQDRVSFIDFISTGITPCYLDLAYMWQARIPENLVDVAQARDFAGFASADWKVFEKGYGRNLTDDPVFQFFYLFKLFKAWKNFSPPGEEIGDWGRSALTAMEYQFTWFLEHHSK